MPRLLLGLTLPLLLAAHGCGPLEMPDLPDPVEAPQVRVDGVELVEKTKEGARFRIHLRMSNPNDVQLPLRLATYQLNVGASSYAGDTRPNVTLPGTEHARSITFSLPAAIGAASVSPGTPWRATGRVRYEPPGKLRQMFTDIGIPLPEVAFSGRGRLAPSPNVSTDEEQGQ